MFHEITISNEQLDVLKKLSQINKITDNFYLAGGTALSLRLGHRKSYDFDFFTFGNFDSESFSDLIKLDFDGSVSSLSDDTVNGNINDIGISFFKYPYKLIRQTDSFNNIKLASLEDLSAMKLSANMKRGTKRDFFDIYELMKIFQLSELKSFFLEKYQQNGNNFYHLSRSLFFFEDAENEADPVSLNGTDWETVKNYFLKNQSKIHKTFI
ncbi:MAG: nucleotidyl transferase AbiEii/AbiGii toxin family protein [Ignavibacteria bacterium]|nr:nucleotidyl transferase AbiEii/AbiGii toxin family protein [Ignavibacteriota bacterium]